MTSSAQFYDTKAQSRTCFFTPSASIVRSEIGVFASKADSLANQIIAQENPSTYNGPVVIRDHHYYPSSPFFWPFYQPKPSVVVVNDSSCSASASKSSSHKDEKDNHAGLLFIAGAAAVVSGIAIYYLGAAKAAYDDANELLGETLDFKEKLSAYQHTVNQEEKALVNEACHTANLKERICKRTKNSASMNILLRSGMLLGCIPTIAGAVLKSGVLRSYDFIPPSVIAAAPTLLMAGCVTGVLSLSGILFKWGFDSTDKANLRDAQSLKNSVLVLNQL